MKKNRYNFPRHATNSNNPIYKKYVEDMYFSDDYDGPISVSDTERTPQWKKNGRLDIYHEPDDNTDYHEDPYTVAQKFMDRSQFTHG